MKHIYTLFAILLIACNTQPPVTNKINVSKDHSLLTELQTFYDLSTLPQFLDSTAVAQVSSYDTTGNNDDGFSGRYSYLRRNTDSTLVIFDVQGSGVMNIAACESDTFKEFAGERSALLHIQPETDLSVAAGQLRDFLLDPPVCEKPSNEEMESWEVRAVAGRYEALISGLRK